MTGRPDARRAMDVDSRVALLGHQRRSEVNSHPHPNVAATGPRVVDQRSLRVDRRGDRGIESLERGEHLVAVRVDHAAAVVGDAAPQEPSDVGQDRRVFGYLSRERGESSPRCRRAGTRRCRCGAGHAAESTAARAPRLASGISAMTLVPRSPVLLDAERAVECRDSVAQPSRPVPSSASAPPMPSSDDRHRDASRRACDA